VPSPIRGNALLLRVAFPSHSPWPGADRRELVLGGSAWWAPIVAHGCTAQGNDQALRRAMPGLARRVMGSPAAGVRVW